MRDIAASPADKLLISQGLTPSTRVLLPSCDIILPIAIVKLLRVLLEPALLVTSSLRLVWVVAGSYAVIAGSSGSIVSYVSTVISVSGSREPGTLQIHTLAQGMPTPAILGMLRARTRQNFL